MPLVKREIQPIFLSRGLDVMPNGITNELQCVTNCTLSSVIRQLSNLARHSEDVFTELYTEANFVYKKSSALQERIERLSVKVTQLDSAHDQDTLEGYMSQTPYHNIPDTDQVILETKTLPLALQETRAMCEPVPPLTLLDPYREDGKEALKLYTNPKYFFELWCQDMQKNINEDQKKKDKKKKKRRHSRSKDSNKPAKVKTKKEQYKAMGMGKEFMPSRAAGDAKAIQSPTSDPENPMADMQGDEPPHQDKRESVVSNQDRRRSHGHRRQSNKPPRKAPAPPSPSHPPAPPPADYNANENRLSMAAQGQYDNIPPPPPPMGMDTHLPPNGNMPPPPPPPPPFDPSIPPAPPVPNGNANIPPPPPFPSSAQGDGANIPAPPPPPPPPGAPNANIPAPPPPPPPGGLTPTPNLTPARNIKDPANRVSQAPTPPRELDSRSELLQAIQQGMNLRRVQVNDKQMKESKPDNTVESILRRRIALQQSDTESETSDSSGSSSSDDQWD